MAKQLPPAGPRKPAGTATTATFRPSGTAQTSGASRPASGHGKNRIVTREDGREVRRMTLYLDPELHRRLAVRCAELDIDMCAGIAAAVEAWLSR